MANIYIVEDDTNIQEIEAIALKNSGHNVEQFEDAKHFYKKIEEKLPDLAILDIMLPDENGYEIVKKLRKNPATKKLPVIMVTAKTSEIDMVKGLDIGADDYIKKPFSIIEFITRIKAVLRRTVEQPDDKYMTIGEIFLDNERHMVYVDNKGIELTYKEYELLILLLNNKGKVVTRDNILNEVWGYDYDAGTNVVDVYVSYLRNKLDEKNKEAYIETVRAVGYIISEK